MNIWKVLEINETKDKDVIINAYRKKLVTVNPEEDQKGFMQLRQAYEEAMKLADRVEDEETVEGENFTDTPVGNWMKQVNQVYHDIARRRDIETWKKLLQNDVCFSLETKTEARDELLRYLMNHNYLPQEIWILLDEKFMLQEYKEELYEIFPVDYINRGVIENIIYEDYIRLDLIESRGGTEYDRYLRLLYNLNYAVSGNQLEEAESLFDEIKELKIYHPYEDMFYANYLIRKEQYDEAGTIIQSLYEKYPDNIEIIREKAVLCMRLKQYDEAKALYEQVLNVKPRYYNVLVEMGNVCFALEEYEDAKEYFDRASDIHRTEYIQERYVECVKALENVYDKKHRDEPENVEYTIDYARAKYQQGNFDESLALLENIEPDEDNRLEYMHLLGCNYMYKENYVQAQEYLEYWMTATEKLCDDGTVKTKKAIRRLSRAYQCIAQNLAGQNRYDEAEIYIDKALATGEHTIEFCEDKARYYLRQKKYDDAIKACDKVFEYDADSVMGHAIRASALKELGYYRDSVEEWSMCIKYEPYDLMYYVKKIEVLFLAGEYDEIKEIIKYLEENGVNEPMVNKWVAVVEGKTGDYNKALEMLTKLIEENEHCEKDYEKQFMAELYFEVARISLNKENNPDKAMTYLDKALVFNATNADALNYKGFILYKTHRYEQAIEVYQKLIEEKPAHFNAYGILGEIHEEQREYDKAIEYYTKQINISPNSYLYMSRGYCHASMNHFEEARADYRKSIEMEPEEFNSYRNLANTYTYEEREEEALPYYEKALATEEGHAEMWCYTDYALALERMGNMDKAIEVLTEGVSNIDNPDISLKLARAYMNAGRYELAERMYYDYATREVNGRYVVMHRLCECLCLMKRENEALNIIQDYLQDTYGDSDKNADIGDLEILAITIRLRNGSYSSFKSDMKNAIRYYLKYDKGNAERIILLKYANDLRKYPVKKIKYQSKFLQELVKKLIQDSDEKVCTERSYGHYMCEKAVISLEKGDLSIALEYVENTLNHRKCYGCDFCKCSDAMFIKAMILELMGRDIEALECYELAVKYDATDFFYQTEYERMKSKMNG